MRALLAVVLAFWALPARCQTAPRAGAFSQLLDQAGDSAVSAPVLGTVHILDEDGEDLDPAYQRTNFSYGEINSRMERIVLGRPRRRGRRGNPPKTGVTPADRVDRGEIKYIVIHSACGTYKGSIEWLLKRPTAAHFIVSRNGDVTRMVDIKNIANHVKNPVIRDASVGIETETGHPTPPVFRPEDWDPAQAWRMYASLAWLIRAISNEAGVPRDEQHIIGHLEADKGIPNAHTDPGPYYYDHVYPDFEQRFPGQNVTPREFLMKLVNDDQPPKIYRSTTTPEDLIRVVSTDKLGVASVRIYGVSSGVQPPPVPAARWDAPEQGLPPWRVELPAPKTPGVYVVEAHDLVGNVTAARFRVDGSSPPAMRSLVVAVRDSQRRP